MRHGWSMNVSEATLRRSLWLQVLHPAVRSDVRLPRMAGSPLDELLVHQGNVPGVEAIAAGPQSLQHQLLQDGAREQPKAVKGRKEPCRVRGVGADESSVDPGNRTPRCHALEGEARRRGERPDELPEGLGFF